MRITVLGAYGYTGKLICSLLNEQQTEFNIAGRSQENLDALKLQFSFCRNSYALDMTLPEGIQQLTEISDCIINCAGPFTETSAGLVQAVAISGKKYLDITGEVPFVRDSENRHQQNCLDSGALIIHGCAFESLVADLGIHLLANQLSGKIYSVHTFYQLSQSRPSPGTRLTMKLSRFREPVQVSEGKWAVSDLQHDRLKINWPEYSDLSVAVPYPLPEIAFSYWDFRPAKAGSYLLLDEASAMFVHAAAPEHQSKDEIVQMHRRKKVAGPDADSRMKQSCNLVIVLKNESGACFKMRLTGTDMYGVTARAILLSLNEIIQYPLSCRGVIAPAKLFSGNEKNVLEKLGFSLHSADQFSFV